MAKDSSDWPTDTAQAPPPARVIAAEALQGVMPFALGELSPGGARAPMPLRARDLDNEVGRTAYALGRRRGLEEGRRLGLEQGRQEGVQQVEASLAGSAAQAARHLQAIAEGLQGELARMEHELADQVVGLAIGIARQVLRREVALDPQALLPAASEALHQLAEGAGRIELQVNPQDAAVLRGHLDRQPGLPPWQLREDPLLPRGGCRAVADTGEIDATLAGRWEAVMASLGRAAEPAP